MKNEQIAEELSINMEEQDFGFWTSLRFIGSKNFIEITKDIKNDLRT